MPQPDSTTIQTIRLMTEGGTYHVPADSGSGPLYRPSAQGDRGGRVSTLETLYDYWIDYVPDPDQALEKDPNFLEKLHSHPDVVAAMRKRSITVAAFPWRIEANPDAPDKRFAKEVADYASFIWRQIPSVEQLYYQCQDEAVLKGGIGFEWTWHQEATGVERPVKFDMVSKDRFVFDRLGNMALKTREYPVWGVYVSANQARNYVRQFPRGKFIYHVYRRQPGRWDKPNLEGYMYYGVGEDVALYYPVTFDAFVLRFRMKWLEKYGIPPVALYHPVNEPVQGQVIRICDSLRGESVITVPRPPGTGKENDFYKIEQLEVPSMTQDAFHTFSKEWTKPHIDSILLGDPEENQGGDHGGYSERVTRRDAGALTWFKWDAQNISSTITSQLLPPLVCSRWPNLPQAFWPVHKLEPKEEKDRAQEVEILEKAAARVPIVEDEYYERAGLRKPGPNDRTVGGTQQAGPGGMPGEPSAPNGRPQPQSTGGQLQQGGAPKPRPGIGQGAGNGSGSVAVKQRTMPRGAGEQ